MVRNGGGPTTIQYMFETEPDYSREEGRNNTNALFVLFILLSYVRLYRFPHWHLSRLPGTKPDADESRMKSATILLGSVVHKNVPLMLAAIHAGDRLAKLLLIAVIVSVWC
jgi:hypothetical protein